MTVKIGEAATIKARVLRLSRELGSILADKTLPDSMRKTIETFRASLKKTWKELEGEAVQDGGRKGIASSEDGLEEYMTGNEWHYISPSITSFEQLDTAEAAKEVAENMHERVGQFQDILNNIFFWSSDDIDKIGAAQNLFNEFIDIVGQVLTGHDEDSDSSIMDSAELGESEAGKLAESYEAPISLVEADPTNPRSPLEMDVQIIRPGWGNARDNNYYPREMLARDAKVFEGAKMYTTDHRQDEKSVRTEVSQIKSIKGFTEEGSPIARVVVFDPDFAEQCRNRAQAGLLGSLECSILADGKARTGFEQDGRKGKVVESITAVSSVDWVTRAGAGGKALNLAESDADPEEDQEQTPVEESETQTVTIHEQDAESDDDAAGEAQQEETTLPAEETHPPVYLGEVEIRDALSKVRLPGDTLLTLAFGKYETVQVLQDAIQAEVKRLKEVSGSGRPFGLGESAAAPDTSKPVSRLSIEETMDKINSRFGIGR